MRVLPLIMLRPGEIGHVVGIQGGFGSVRRLFELGFTPGEPVRIVAAGRGGPVLVEVRGSRIALGRGMAARVLVRRVS